MSRVPLHGRPNNFINVEPGATVGATIGKNVYGADGKVFDPAAYVAQAIESAASPTAPTAIGPLKNAADDAAAAIAGVAIGALYRNGSAVMIRVA